VVQGLKAKKGKMPRWFDQQPNTGSTLAEEKKIGKSFKEKTKSPRKSTINPL